MKRIATTIGLLLALAFAAVTALVEIETDYRLESLGGAAKARALVLFHPSRDSHFSDDLSSALADGLKAAGFSVDRATLTRDTPGALKDYAVVAVVSNTYWWTPDLPTLRYLARARLDGIPAIGLIGGAGSTGRAQTILEEALRKTGARVLRTHSLWLWRPNDQMRTNQPNRAVALEMAKQFGMDDGAVVLAAATPSS